MWPPQVTKSSQGQLALEIMLTEGLWIKEIPHTQKLFMTSFEPRVLKRSREGMYKSPPQGQCGKEPPGAKPRRCTARSKASLLTSAVGRNTSSRLLETMLDCICIFYIGEEKRDSWHLCEHPR